MKADDGWEQYLRFDRKRYAEKLEEFFERQKQKKEPERKSARVRPKRNH